MDSINRIDFYKNRHKNVDFEILELDDFFESRKKYNISRVFRINFYIMIYITEGCGKHEIDFVTYDYKAGDVIFIAQNQVHRFFEYSGAKGYIIFFTDDFLYNQSELNIKEFLDYFNLPLYKPIISIDTSQSHTNNVLIELIYNEYKNEENNSRIALLKSLFRSFMISFRGLILYEEKVDPSTVYKRFIDFKNLVEEYYKEKKNVADYAKLMLVSQKTINQTTRKIADLSAKQFIIERILLEIKRYLSQGELTINEISYMMGFDEPSNFTKFFKRYTNMSPGEFRKRYRE